jgi:hypothetical protein
MKRRKEVKNKKKKIKTSVNKTVIKIRIKKKIKANVFKTVIKIYIRKKNKKRQ